MAKKHRRKRNRPNPQNTTGIRKKRTLPEAARKYMWKPGQSGNPGGRPKKLTRILDVLLDAKVPNDPKKRSYKKLFVEAFLKRAIAKSDVAAKEIFDRVEGKLSYFGEGEEGAPGSVHVIVLDVPRPDRAALIPAIDVSGDGHKPTDR